MNLLPEARGTGIGLALLSQLRAALVARGVAGMHGVALASNGPVHGLLAKVGFVKSGSPYAVPGLRTPAGERLYGQLVLCDLRSGAERAADLPG
jgi:L-amino acid N-acyltransferase YncA